MSNEKLEKLANLPFFRINHLKSFYPEIKNNSLYRKITRWKKKGDIIELKKGYYTHRTYFERNSSDSNFTEYLANILCRPSYVSGSYVLQMKGILTDITYPITSITTKSTRAYSNKIGEFAYSSISRKLYGGYEKKYFKTEPVYIAKTSKALFDYLYIKYFKSGISAEEILEKERLNIEVLSDGDIKEFAEYCELSKNKNLIKISGRIKNYE